MPLQETSGAASYDAFGGGVPVVPTYIEEVFSTWLYTGTGTTLPINNGIDLSGKGGLLWVKDRTFSGENNWLYDTARGYNKALVSNTTGQSSTVGDLSSFNTNGFTVASDATSNINYAPNNPSPHNYVTWTFREQPKFFDVVTWTGSSDSGTSIGQGIVPHSLGSAPGCVIIKNVTQGATNWIVYHRSLSGGYRMLLNTTDAQTNAGSAGYFSKYVSGVGWTQTDPDANNIYVGYNYQTNGNGDTLVAYLFAHNAGGFGLTGTDNVISCGSYTGNGSGTGPVVTLGWEPQWLLIKRAGGAANWVLFDTMRGLTTASTPANQPVLVPNTNAAETSAGSSGIGITSTGFQILDSDTSLNTSGNNYIYIAIRRGPMKTPTSGTSVFSPNAFNAVANTYQTTGFPIDWQITADRTGAADKRNYSRLTGVATPGTTAGRYLSTNTTDAEAATGSLTVGWDNTGFRVPSSYASTPFVGWNFGRAPGFFDQVCYTGTSSVMTVNHNLGVAPELMIFKNRSAARRWPVYTQPTGNTQALVLNTSDAVNSTGNNYFNSTSPTSTVFTVNGAFADIGNSGNDYVAYLFASCPGVSKVGSYTGTGATLTIDCGFTGGARFVLIKRTNSTGTWWVWDTARGMVAGTDPRLLLNDTNAETNTNWVYTTTGGFQIVTSDATVNANGGSYIFLAIA